MDYLDTFYDIMLAAGLENPITREAWLERTREAVKQGQAELWPLGKGGEMVGGVFFMGTTVHIAVLPEWHGRWATTALRRAYDTWTHTAPILAPIKPDNAKAIELARRLGFTYDEESGDQGLYHLYVKPANAPAEQPAEEAAHAP